MNESSPRKVSYTDKDVANAAKFDRYRKGWYALLLTDIGYAESKDNGHHMFVPVYNALTDPRDAGSIKGPKLRKWVCLPFRNEGREDHVPKKMFARTMTEWLAAHLAEAPTEGPLKGKSVPMPPQLVDKQWVYKGEPLERDDIEAKRVEAYDSGYEVGSMMLEDESDETMKSLIGTLVFAYIDYDEGSDFPNLDRMTPALPDGAELVDPEHWFDAGDDAAENENGEEAPAPKATKPAPKPAPKGNKKKK